MLIQILIAIFIVFALGMLIKRFRNVEIKLSEFVFWGLFWVLAGVAVWVPNFLTEIALRLGIGRGADLVLYVSVVVVFYLIFRIYVKLEKMERNITKVVRDKAIGGAEKKEK